MPTISVRDIELSKRLANAVLAAAKTGLSDREILILPRHTRDNQEYYDEEDIESAKLARQVALEARPLDGAEREYLHEYAAGWEDAVALAIAANLSADTIILLARFFVLKARRVVSRGLHPGPPSAVPLKVQATRVTDIAGSETRSILIEGAARDVVDVLAPTLAAMGIASASEFELPPEIMNSLDAPQVDGPE